MKEKARHYFACANTAEGFKNYFDSNLYGLKKIYILKGGPGTGKSTLMKRIGKFFADKEAEVEYIHCSSDPDSLDGVVIRSAGIGVVDGTSPHVVEPKAPGAIEEYINLGVAWRIEELEPYSKLILSLQKSLSKCYQKAYHQMEMAKKVHDQWEKVYLQNMNFEQLNRLGDVIVKEVFKDMISAASVKENEVPVVYHRFFGCSTYKGPVDYIENLTADVSSRFFIKGRPGTGKSTILKKIVKKAVELREDVEVYHCGFDPVSLDMVLLPECRIAVFDSTKPHEYFPSKENDYIFDVYEEAVNPGTDETHEVELSGIKDCYQEYINDSIDSLRKAKQLHDELEAIYIRATDFSKIDLITQGMLDKFEKLH